MQAQVEGEACRAPHELIAALNHEGLGVIMRPSRRCLGDEARSHPRPGLGIAHANVTRVLALSVILQRASFVLPSPSRDSGAQCRAVFGEYLAWDTEVRARYVVGKDDKIHRRLATKQRVLQDRGTPDESRLSYVDISRGRYHN